MDTVVLHDPFFRFYVLYVAGLSCALIWDYWRCPVVTRGQRGGREEMGK
jgi:hypothetical protein